MNKKEQMELAKILAVLTKTGCSVFAQYNYFNGEETFKGIFISSKNKEDLLMLEETAEIVTTQKGLTGKR